MPWLRHGKEAREISSNRRMGSGFYRQIGFGVNADQGPTSAHLASLAHGSAAIGSAAIGSVAIGGKACGF
jgi:hypothetical protein